MRTRKFKRMIALLTVALFLISVAAPSAFAATKEEAFGRLNALSVAIGGTGGDPMYDKNFTRAEAAAIMVNLSGMKAAIDSAKGDTKFADVPKSHWASGVVNLAVGAGIIKGYPDGKYKPEANVTYAEMCAMLVQVLGYAPKLQGTWPSNVVSKAAQLGLLDGVTVTDVNAAAVRSNVFLASDKALTVKPLVEKKDGYEEDAKTLMEKKLSVTKKDEAIVTLTPAFGGADKKKATITYTATNHSPATDVMEVTAGINPDDFFGLKVEAWVKDDKVFFFNIKTNSSDIITDTIKEIRDASNNVLAANGDNAFNITLNSSGIAKASDASATTVGYIKLDKADKVVSVRNTAAVTDTKWYKNYTQLTAGSSANIGNGGSVKVILGSDGKADYVLCTAFSTGLINSVDTSNEKINFKSDASATGSLTLKDKKYLVYKNGVAATLADLKKGDVVDYIASAGTNGDVFLVYATDKSETVKITGVLDDGRAKDNTYVAFKFGIGDKSVGAAKTIYVSTNNADTYSAKGGTLAALTSDFNSILNKDVTVKYNKSGKITHIIAGAAASDADIPVLVKYIKKVTSTETKRYIYVAKFDGTQTYYEVTKNAKIDGIKVNESALKQTANTNAGEGDWTEATNAGNDGPRLVPNSVTTFPGLTTKATGEITSGDIVKLNLNSDNTVNEIKTYGTNLQSASSYTVNKDNATFQVSGGTVLVLDDNTKTIKVKAVVANAASDNVAAVNRFLSAANVVDDVTSVSLATLKSLNSTFSNNAAVVKDGGKAKQVALLDAGQSVASSAYFGIVIAKGTNANGNSYATIGHDGKAEDIEGTAPAKNSVITYTLATDGKISTAAANTTAVVYSGYSIYKVDSISDRQIKLIPADSNYIEVTGHDQWIVINLTTTEAWDISSSSVPAAKIAVDDVIGHYVKVYDVWNKDRNPVDLNGDGDSSDTGENAADNVIDYLMMVKK